MSRSKVKVIKVKNVIILVFSLVSEKMVQGQGHNGQGHRGQGQRSLVKVTGSRSNLLGELPPPSICEMCDTRAFSLKVFSGFRIYFELF